MKTFSRTSSLIAAAALAVASLPALAVQPFQADYSANYMGMQANGTMTLAAAAPTSGATRSPSRTSWPT